MCGRYTEVVNLHEVVTALAVDDVLAELNPPSFNVAPTQLISIVRQPANRRQLELFSWGLQPAWLKPELAGANLINARIETVTEKPSFREAIKYRRCLIPAAGWYEWQTTVASAGRKQPYYFKADQAVLAFAGIYEMSVTGEPTAAIITQPANEVVGAVHDRMPLILNSEFFELWLDPTQTCGISAINEVASTSIPKLYSHPVSTEVNSARASGEHLILPAVAEPIQPGLFD